LKFANNLPRVFAVENSGDEVDDVTKFVKNTRSVLQKDDKILKVKLQQKLSLTNTYINNIIKVFVFL
jgi:hypothetical protein